MTTASLSSFDVGRIVEAIAVVLEELLFLQHLAGDVEAVELRAVDFLQRELRPRHEHVISASVRLPCLAGIADAEFGGELRRVRIGQDDRAEDLVDVLLVDLRRLEDLRADRSCSSAAGRSAFIISSPYLQSISMLRHEVYGLTGPKTC